MRRPTGRKGRRLATRPGMSFRGFSLDRIHLQGSFRHDTSLDGLSGWSVNLTRVQRASHESLLSLLFSDFIGAEGVGRQVTYNPGNCDATLERCPIWHLMCLIQ